MKIETGRSASWSRGCKRRSPTSSRSSRCTPDAIIVNFGGRRVLGSGDLRRAMEAGLASPLAQVITTAEIDDIRYVRPDVAIVSCTKHISDQRDTTESFATEGRLTYVAVKEDGAWRVALAQTTPVVGS